MAPQTLLVVFLGVAVIVEGGVFPLTSPDNKIHTGTVTDISKFPWMVAILRNDLQHCGGVIISQDWILTAAHCTKRVSKSELKLRVGSTRYATGGQEYFADKIVEHPDYVPGSEHYDISAIKTTKPINFVGHVAKAKLSTSSPSPSMNVMIAGWGMTPNNQPSPTLRAAKFVVTPFQKCQEKLHTVNPQESFQICADGVNGHICSGDSGSALTNGDVLVGIASIGFRVGNNFCPGLSPALFTRVAFFRKWIQHVTNV